MLNYLIPEMTQFNDAIDLLSDGLTGKVYIFTQSDIKKLQDCMLLGLELCDKLNERYAARDAYLDGADGFEGSTLRYKV